MDRLGFIERSNLVHDNKYRYDITEYALKRGKVDIRCLDHGVFQQRADHHLAGHGCKICGIAKQAKLQALTTEDFIVRANKLHGCKYTYDTTVYVSAFKELEIYCPDHGSFWQIAHHHLAGHGCRNCANALSANIRKSTIEQFIEKSNCVHKNKYSYNYVVYQSNHNKIVIECPVHGCFEQTPSNHLAGYGCVKCANKISKNGTAWLDSLGVPLREHRLKFGDRFIRVDGYDPINEIIYQFHGDFWHGNILCFNQNEINKKTKTTFGELYQNTITNDNLIRASMAPSGKHYRLVTMWELDWDSRRSYPT